MKRSAGSTAGGPNTASGSTTIGLRVGELGSSVGSGTADFTGPGIGGGGPGGDCSRLNAVGATSGNPLETCAETCTAVEKSSVQPATTESARRHPVQDRAGNRENSIGVMESGGSCRSPVVPVATTLTLITRIRAAGIHSLVIR